jgi:hypothetical protein
MAGWSRPAKPKLTHSQKRVPRSRKWGPDRHPRRMRNAPIDGLPHWRASILAEEGADAASGTDRAGRSSQARIALWAVRVIESDPTLFARVERPPSEAERQATAASFRRLADVVPGRQYRPSPGPSPSTAARRLRSQASCFATRLMLRSARRYLETNSKRQRAPRDQSPLRKFEPRSACNPLCGVFGAAAFIVTKHEDFCGFQPSLCRCK